MNTEIKILTLNEFKILIYGNSGIPKKIYKNLEKEIHYFSWDDICGFSNIFASDKYKESLRYIVCIDKKSKKILGIAKIAIYKTSNNKISCSYLSVNKNFRNLGISKLLIDTMLNFVKIKYNNKLPFGSSQYSVSGYLYLHNYIVNKCKELNLKLIDNVVGYDDRELYDDLFYSLVDKTKKYENIY
jgi:hypothetical protein